MTEPRQNYAEVHVEGESEVGRLAWSPTGTLLCVDVMRTAVVVNHLNNKDTEVAYLHEQVLRLKQAANLLVTNRFVGGAVAEDGEVVISAGSQVAATFTGQDAERLRELFDLPGWGEAR